MEQPEGFKVKGQEHKVLCMYKALYGLKQAVLQWWKELQKSMAQLGFKHAQSNASIFIHTATNGEKVITVIYIDDAGFMGFNIAPVKEKKQAFMARWKCHDLGKLKEFLGITIKCIGQKVMLDQTVYLDKVLEHFGMTNVIPAKTPILHAYQPIANTGISDPTLQTQYQAIIGSLLYLMLGTCPDIAYAVIKLSQFSANPSKDHSEQAKYICCYLVVTKDYTMVFDGMPGKGLITHSNSNHYAPNCGSFSLGHVVK